MKEGRFIGWMPLLVSRPRRLYLSTASQILISQNCQTAKHAFPTLNWTTPKRKQWGHRSETCAFHISWIGDSGISAWFKKNFRRRGSLSTLSTCLTICQFHNKFSTEFFCGILFRTVTCLIPWNINKLYQTNIFFSLGNRVAADKLVCWLQAEVLFGQILDCKQRSDCWLQPEVRERAIILQSPSAAATSVLLS